MACKSFPSLWNLEESLIGPPPQPWRCQMAKQGKTISWGDCCGTRDVQPPRHAGSTNNRLAPGTEAAESIKEPQKQVVPFAAVIPGRINYLQKIIWTVSTGSPSHPSPFGWCIPQQNFCLCLPRCFTLSGGSQGPPLTHLLPSPTHMPAGCWHPDNL